MASTCMLTYHSPSIPLPFLLTPSHYTPSTPLPPCSRWKEKEIDGKHLHVDL